MPANLPAVRAAFAIAVSVLVLVAAVAPHAHHDTLGPHACLACVAGSAEAAVTQTPDVAPLRVATAAPPVARPEAPAVGFPLGAVRGQSPPAA